MQPELPRDMLSRIIRGLRRFTAVCLVVGGCLFVGALVLIPVLGFAAAGVSAVGLWCLLVGALTAGLLLAAAALHRVRSGRWYFGEPDAFTSFVAAHRAGFITLAAILVIWILVTLAWLGMN